MANNQNRYQRNNNDNGNNEISFDLMEHIGVIEEKDSGWTKEVNIVAWNGGQPKVDIRDWDPTHERMSKGITLFEQTAERLADALAKRYRGSDSIMPDVDGGSLELGQPGIAAGGQA